MGTATNQPQIVVEIAFTTDELLTIPGAWTDVSSYVLEDGFSVRRGRADELQAAQASRATVVLNNQDRRFEPGYVSSAYYPNVRPRRRIRISATWASVTYRLWQGFISKWTPSIKGNQSVVTVEAEDLIGAYLARASFPPVVIKDSEWASSTETIVNDPVMYANNRKVTITAYETISSPRPARDVYITGYDENGLADSETLVVNIEPENTSSNPLIVYGVVRWSIIEQVQIQPLAATDAFIKVAATDTFPTNYANDAIDEVLDSADLAASDRDITALTSTIIDDYAVEGRSVNAIIQSIADAEAGFLWVSKDGKITFRRRDTRDTATMAASFGGSTTPYLSVTYTYGDQYIYNEIALSGNAGIVYQLRDADSILEFGRSTYSRSGVPVMADLTAVDYVTTLLNRYKQPRTRIDNLELSGYLNPSVLWPAILGLELNDCIYVRPTSTYGATGYWVLGDTALGILGSTTILGDDSVRCFVEQINYTMSKGMWNTSLRVSPA